MFDDRWRAVWARDRAANRFYPKSLLVLYLLRLAQSSRDRTGGALLYPALASVYKVISEWILGIEIPPSTQVGAGLRLRHGIGIVVNPHAVIGEDVMIRHGVTIGNRRTETDCPVIGRGVEIGAGATIIGAVTIGDEARIGAGAVVAEDVPPRGMAYQSGTVIREAGVRM